MLQCARPSRPMDSGRSGLGDGVGAATHDVLDPPLRRVVDDVADMGVVVPTTDLPVADLHHTHERVIHHLTGVEHPALHVFPDHQITLGDDVLGEVVVARQRFDADLEASNNVGSAHSTHRIHTHIGVVAIVGEEGGHGFPVPLEMGVPVILNDLFIAGFGAVHDLSFITVCAAAYDTDDDGAMHEIEISTDTIRLGQFLKLSNLVDSGSDAKFLLAEGEVMVNDEVEIRRGRQLRAGDVVEYDGIAVRVVAAD